MPSLTVMRTSDRDVRHRQVILSLDGAPLATLMFGQQATATVAPGRHALRAYNTLVWKTIEFDVVEDQDVTFQIVNRPGRFTYILVTLLGVGPIYVDIERA
jgi:hypothetical protein